MLRTLLTATTLCLLARNADAGACLGDDEIDEGVKLLEQRVTKPKVDMGYYGICLPGAFSAESTKPAAKRIGRINAACTKILTKTPTDAQCVMLAGMQGTAELGGAKIFEAVVAWNSTPWSSPPGDIGWLTDLDILLELGDARAVPLVVERWNWFEIEAAKREAAKRGKANAMMMWSTWRRKAAAVIGALGGKDEAAFLDAKAAATKDTYVKKACRDGAKAIRARNP